MGRHTYRTLRADAPDPDLARDARNLDLVVVGLMVGVLIAMSLGWIS